MAVVGKMIIQHSLINSFAHSCVTLGLKVAHDRNPYLDVYRNYFENDLGSYDALLRK